MGREDCPDFSLSLRFSLQTLWLRQVYTSVIHNLLLKKIKFLLYDYVFLMTETAQDGIKMLKDSKNPDHYLIN